MTLLGSIHFMSGIDRLAQTINGAVTTAIYVVCAWTIILILRMIFVAPFEEWKEKETKIAALKAKIEGNPLRAREIEAQESQTAALRDQIEEMRLHRAQREKENDPLVKAFFEKRLDQYKKGETFEEETIHLILHWIANRSAWGRFQDVHSVHNSGGKLSDWAKMHFAISCLQLAAESGELIICGRRSGQSTMEPISPDFWRNVAGLGIKSDPRTIWKIYVVRRSFSSEESVELPTYSLLQSDMKRVRELWSEHDTELDAKTNMLFGEPNKND